MAEQEELKRGLEGVLAAESDLSYIDGEAGRLVYRGYDIDDLAREASFEEVLYLLWHGELPTRALLDSFRETMAAERHLDDEVLDVVARLADGDETPMAAMRTVASLLSAHDPDANADPQNLPANVRKGRRITAKLPTALAAFDRLRRGEEPVAPREDLGHAANFLYMLHGEEPDDAEAAAMDAALILYAEHGMNASTFAGVVTVSTLASVYSALTSAIGALEGPLHGGATETVVDMLDDVGSPEHAADRVQEKLDAGEKIPGFGHRVYRAVDPRCQHFKHHIDALAGDETEERVETIEAVREHVVDALGEKGIYPNTDLYSGRLYGLLDIPPAFYTALFATARVAGWSAHLVEQLDDNRIMRPRVRYPGEIDRDWVPLEDR